MSEDLLDLLWFIVFMLVILVALVANMIIILAILRDRSMHTSTYFYIINVAIADILLVLCCLPERTVALFRPDDGFPLGLIACYLIPYLQQVSMHAALAFLLILTVHRCYPAGVPSYLQRDLVRQQIRNYPQILCLIWLFAILINFPLFSITKYGKQTITRHDNSTNASQTTTIPTCDTEAKELWSRAYLILLLVFTYLITGIFLIVIYGRVIRIMLASNKYAKKINEEIRQRPRQYHFLAPNVVHQEKLREMLARTSTSSASNNRPQKRNSSDTPAISMMISTGQNRSVSNTHSIQRLQVIIMLFIVIVLYIVLLLPYRLLNLLFIVHNQLFQQHLMNDILLHWLVNIVRLLVFLNCALQPIIYLVISSRLRQTVIKFLRACCYKYYCQCRCSLTWKTDSPTIEGYQKKQVIWRDPHRAQTNNNGFNAVYQSLPWPAVGRARFANKTLSPTTPLRKV